MMNEWRRKSDSDTWHFCTNCTNWPTRGAVESVALEAGIRPADGELCNECQSKRKRKKCNPEFPRNVEGGKPLTKSESGKQKDFEERSHGKA